MATATEPEIRPDLFPADPDASTPIASPGPMTTEEMLALPGGEVDRELFDGELRERPMTTRNVPHSFLIAELIYTLRQWLDTQPEPRGMVLGGEARVRLKRNPDTTVGVDVAYLAPELAAQTPRGAKFVDGPPTLAVEILSPSDTFGDVWEKVAAYLDAGVPLVWVVDPTFETIAIHRPGARPKTVNLDDTIEGEPLLPGFAAAVGRVFSR